MKKIITLAMCGLAVVAMNAQKANVDQAKKLAGKVEKIEEARALINQAIQNPETSGDALTYYTAGKIEWDAYDKNAAKQMVNPDAVDAVEMANELLNGYNYFLQVFPLDQIPNEKGEVKPKYTKEIQKKIAEKENNFWEAGAVLFGEKKFYPEAYNAFMIFGDLPELAVLGDKAPVVADTLRATSYFNAGLAAWSADKVDEAAVAFQKARENNYTQPEAYIYEIACWQNIEQKDESRENEARDKIYAAAQAGFEKFGMDQPVFLNNMVNSMLNSEKENEALEIVNNAIALYPDKASLFGLRGFIYDRMKNEDAAEADYRKAADMPDVDYDTMRNAITKLLRVGQEKWNEIELSDPEIMVKKDNIRKNYFQEAKRYAEKAKSLTEDPSDLDYLMESIDYALTL